MIIRRTLFPALVVTLSLLSTGCATRYQELLRDRDMEIRELQGQLADARAELEASRRAPAQPREASVPTLDDELVTLRTNLDGLDVDRRDGRLTIKLPDTVTFDSGSAQLKKSASDTLQRIAGELARYRNRRIFVAGHTDTDPIKATAKRFRSNRHLSAERADAVASWLVDQGGVESRHVVVLGYGPWDPVAEGKTEADKARNRRVEIQIEDTAARSL